MMYSVRALIAACVLNQVAGFFELTQEKVFGTVEVVHVVGYDENVSPSGPFPAGCAGTPSSDEACRPMYEKAEEKFLSYFDDKTLYCTDLESFVFDMSDCEPEAPDDNRECPGDICCKSADPTITLFTNPDPMEDCTLEFVGASIVNFLKLRQREPISPTNWIEDRSGVDFDVIFSEGCGEVIGAGFGTVDFNDQDGDFSFSITRTDAAGDAKIIEINDPFPGGSVLYTALIEIEQGFALEKITVGSSKASEGDIFGHDDFCVLVSDNVKPCVDGIVEGNVCCCAGCGSCGGCGCQELPGGPDECCIGSIQEVMMACVNPFDCGCILDVPGSGGFVTDPTGGASGDADECPSREPTITAMPTATAMPTEVEE